LPERSVNSGVVNYVSELSLTSLYQTAWYSLRLRLSTIYALSELSLLAPSPSLTPSERTTAAIDYSDRLFDQTAKLGQEMDNVGLFAEWVTKSWAGIARSKFA
jgi:hypothetical protein